MIVVVMVVGGCLLASRCRGRKSYRHPKGGPKLSVDGISQAKVLLWYRQIIEETLTAFDWEELGPDIRRAHGLDDVNAEPKDSLRTNNRGATDPTPISVR